MITIYQHRHANALLRFAPAALILLVIGILLTRHRSFAVDFMMPTRFSNKTCTAPTQASVSVASTSSAIPEKHWQTFKAWLDPTQTQSNLIRRIQSSALLSATHSWRKINPGHRYELISDSTADSFVKSAFPNAPRIVESFLAVKDNIVRADFIRYLILFAYGGVYSDVDTIALKPISTWIPPEYVGKANFVVGIEIDEPGVMWADWADNFVLCQSTLMSKANHGILDRVIKHIIKALHQQAEKKGTDIASLKFSFGDVLRITGPIAFSNAVFSYLSEVTGEEITRSNLTGLRSPKLVADVLVMPTVAFVPGQPHSNSGSPNDAGALVEHLGMGSWTANHVFQGSVMEQDKKEKEEEQRKKEEEEEQRKKLEEQERREKEEQRKTKEEKAMQEAESKRKAEEERERVRKKQMEREWEAEKHRERQQDASETDIRTWFRCLLKHGAQRTSYFVASELV